MKYIVIHCSDSPHGRGDTAKTIHGWHLERGFDAIGYHHVILEDGTVENGRPHWWTGAHAKGYNTDSIGVCLIGEGVYTPQQWGALERLVTDLKNTYPDSLVVGHNDLDNAKTCPNFDAKAWWQSF